MSSLETPRQKQQHESQQ